MKSARCALCLVFLLFSISSLSQSQPQSDGQASFEAMKTLAGKWEGLVTVDPPQPGLGPGKQLHISMHVASQGNALEHELRSEEAALSEVTMFYTEGDHLALLHYCDYGSRPRLASRPTGDGKKLDFGLVDVSGDDKNGHVSHATFTIVDADHHTEEWWYLQPGDKKVYARIDLRRVK